MKNDIYYSPEKYYPSRMSKEDIRNQRVSTIAKFMGIKYFGGYDTWFLIPLGNHHSDGYREQHASKFTYDTSLDALMPVIDKIEQECINDKWRFKFNMTLNNGHRPYVNFERQEAYDNRRSVPHWDMPHISVAEYEEPMTKYEAAFIVVADFISWFNEAEKYKEKVAKITEKRLATRKKNLEKKLN